MSELYFFNSKKGNLCVRSYNNFDSSIEIIVKNIKFYYLNFSHFEGKNQYLNFYGKLVTELHFNKPFENFYEERYRVNIELLSSNKKTDFGSNYDFKTGIIKRTELIFMVKPHCYSENKEGYISDWFNKDRLLEKMKAA